MALINRAVRWTKQPRNPAGIDGSNPLTNGLAFLLEPVRKLGLTRMNLSALTGDATNRYTDSTFHSLEAVSTSRWGSFSGLSTGVDSADWIVPVSALNTLFAASGRATIVAIVRSNATDAGGDSSILSMRGSGVDFDHYPFTDNLIYLSTFQSARWVSGATPPSSINEPHMFAVTAKSGAQEFLFNNQSVATGTNGATPSLALGYFGKRGYLYYLALWDRILAKAELTSLYKNPWQVFAPVSPRRYLPGTAGGEIFAAGLPPRNRRASRADRHRETRATYG